MAVRWRALFPWPAWSEATDEVVALVRSSEDWLDAAPPTLEQTVETWLQASPLAGERRNLSMHGLAHPLAEAFASRAPAAPAAVGRSLHERRVLDEFGPRLTDAIAAPDPHDFTRGLATLASHGLGRRVSPRRRTVGTEHDLEGVRIGFAPSAELPERLALIHGRLRDDEAPIIYRAAVGMAAISNCHPFEDGNGRTGRMLFNAMLRTAARRPALYAPLHELAALSGGGLTLAMREAELHGRWEALFRFVERSLFLMVSGALAPPELGPRNQATALISGKDQNQP